MYVCAIACVYLSVRVCSVIVCVCVSVSVCVCKCKCKCV